jgi:hypothetical protein
MQRRFNVLIAALILWSSPTVHAQATSTLPPVKTPVNPTDLRIVQRAAAILDSPTKWNRAETGDCPAAAATLSLYCALAKAAVEVNGKIDDRSAAIQEARVTIDLIAAQKYGARFVDFNNDPATTFADLQMFFRILQRRLARRMAEEAPPSAQQAPLEASNARLAVDEVDVRIVRRAREILRSPALWNRADTRFCPVEEKTFSLYCALEKATQELSGKFQHRGAAMQEARFVIEDIAPNVAYYDHRLMDYNNDPATTFFDVQKFFQLLEDRVAKRLSEQHTAKGAN